MYDGATEDLQGRHALFVEVEGQQLSDLGANGHASSLARSFGQSTDLVGHTTGPLGHALFDRADHPSTDGRLDASGELLAVAGERVVR